MEAKQFNGSERRAYVRLEKALEVQLRITGNPTSQTYLATTKNISQGGLCIEIKNGEKALLDALFAAGHKIGIDINSLIPHQNNTVAEMPLWVNGRVDWARESDQTSQALQIGLEFEDLTDEARKHIRDYLVDQFLRQYPQQL
ncbi:MAG: PilZ domain-containing protein [Desulfobacterales bacterium]|nr:PilZ domain-containing protein [Desulfobacterales bacterium]